MQSDLLTAGIMMIRGTRDANNSLHPISISRFYAPENDRSVGAHIGAELHLGLDLDRTVRSHICMCHLMCVIECHRDSNSCAPCHATPPPTPRRRNVSLSSTA